MVNRFFDVTKIVGAISSSGGYARPTQYEATVTPPNVLQLNAADGQRITMNCYEIPMKGKRILTKTYEPGGNVGREVPVAPVYEQVALMFYLSQDLVEKRLFDAWMNLLYDPDTGNLNYIDGTSPTAGDALTGVIQLDKPFGRGVDSGAFATIIYSNVFPIQVGDVDNRASDTNRISLLPVVFSYWKWESDFSSSQISTTPY